MTYPLRKTDDFGSRVSDATARRFEDRPQLIKLSIGDFVGHVPVVEDAFRLPDGRRITVESEDVNDPDLYLIGEGYEISQCRHWKDAAGVWRVEGQGWFAAFISPENGSAGRVRAFAGRLGVKAYWPRSVRVLRRGKAKKEVVIVSPVFPRYVLMHLPVPAPPFGLFRSHEAKVNGLAGFVTTAGEPIRIPDTLVDRLVQRERGGSFNHTAWHRAKRVAQFPEWCFIGALVKVAEGPFASFTAFVEAIDLGRARVSVSVEIFGRATPLEIDVAALESV